MYVPQNYRDWRASALADIELNGNFLSPHQIRELQDDPALFARFQDKVEAVLYQDMAERAGTNCAQHPQAA